MLVARPATSASMTIWRALVEKGSTKKTPARAASEVTRIQRREARSIRRPAKKPMTTIGRNSGRRSALTQFESSVRSHTSMTSATNASQVPMLEASVARKSSRNDLASRNRPSPAPLRALVTDRTVAATLEGNEPSKGGLCGLEHALERRSEERVLLLGPDGDADRAGSTEGAERTDDHALSQQGLEHRARVLAHLDEDEVGHRRSCDLETERRAGIGQLSTAGLRLLAPARDLLVV